MAKLSKITEDEFDSLLKQLQEHAQANGFILNPDEKVVKNIIIGLIRNRQMHGGYFCPCRLRKDQSLLCPCASHKEDIQRIGKCLCGLFLRGAKNAEKSA